MYYYKKQLYLRTPHINVKTVDKYEFRLNYIPMFLNINISSIDGFQLESKLKLPFFAGFTVVPFNWLC